MSGPQSAPEDAAARLWQRTSRALDVVLDCDGDARVAALAALQREDPDVHREVVSLLAAAPLPTARLAGAAGDAAAALVGETGAASGSVIGDWRLLHLLGRGGMGEVYLAERADGSFQQEAALKLVRRGLDSEEVVARFLQERQILARLDHPGIARLLDGGLAPDGRPYFVLERCEGEPIREHVERQGLDVRGIVRLLLAVCDAVEAAHRALVVHRDLKPSNILVAPDGEVKLLDFGIAKLLAEPEGEEAITRTELRRLTPSYAAPEQILGGEVSTATDAYSLGVVLFELLVGERPFPRRGTSPTELALEVRAEEVPLASTAARRRAREGEPAGRERLERRAKELQGELDAILLQALAPEPGRRYPTVAAFASDLRRHLDGRPVHARGDSWGYRTRKLVRRHRLALAALALVVAGLAAGLAAAVWQAARASREAARAQRVQEFLVDVFEGVDPSHTRGASVTARELLDAGAQRLERELAGEEETRAALADVLARTYLGLGAVPQAERWARVATEERRRRLGPGAPATALAELTGAEVDLAAGRIAAARATFERLQPRLEHAFGVDAPEALRGRRDLAAVLVEFDELEPALRLQRRVAAWSERHLGPDHPTTAGDLASVAGTLAGLGRYREAEPVLRDALARCERAGAGRTPQAIQVRTELADVLQSEGRADESRRLFAETVELARQVLGPRHPAVADLLLKQGVTLIEARELPQARAALEEALSILQPIGHFDAGAAMRYLGFVAAAEERYPEAKRHFVAAETWFRDRLGPDHAMTWAAISARSLAETRLGELHAAEAHQRAAIAALSRAPGDTANEVRAPMKYLGETLRREGRFDEAIEVHRQCLALELRLFGDGPQLATAVTRNQLALDLLARGRPDDLAEARRLADETLAWARASSPARLGEYLATSGRVALAQGDRARARSELAEAVARFTAEIGSDRPSTVAARRALADAERRQP